MASAVPCMRLGKNMLVEGMKELKLPPPQAGEKGQQHQDPIGGVAGFCTA